MPTLPPIVLSDAVQRRARSMGEQGEAWLHDLRDLLARLANDWGLDIGESLPGGSAGFVAFVTLESGTRAVLKVPIYGQDPKRAASRVLQAANGAGYVGVLRYDPASDAMLMERLGPSLESLRLPIDEQIRHICRTLEIAWRTPIDGVFPDGAEKARDLSECIRRLWQELDAPCSRRVIDQALRFAELRCRAHDPATAVLAHADAHSSNTLLVPDSRPTAFKLVDPEGLFIERAYDLAIPMRDWGAELLAGDPVALGKRRCRLLAALTGVDEQPIWEWGFVERVSTGLLLKSFGFDDEAREYLTVAEAFAHEGSDPS